MKTAEKIKRARVEWVQSETGVYVKKYSGEEIMVAITQADSEATFTDNYQEALDNARLIAAAPELLECVRFCQSVIRSGGMFDLSERMAFDKAEEVIKKATE